MYCACANIGLPLRIIPITDISEISISVADISAKPIIGTTLQLSIMVGWQNLSVGLSSVGMRSLLTPGNLEEVGYLMCQSGFKQIYIQWYECFHDGSDDLKPEHPV